MTTTSTAMVMQLLSTTQQDKEKEASERLMAFFYLENSDKSIYGSLITGLSSQHSLG
jgi:hypothetical protein